MKQFHETDHSHRKMTFAVSACRFSQLDDLGLGLGLVRHVRLFSSLMVVFNTIFA